MMPEITGVQTSAGRGTRFRPLNLYSPTSMIPKGMMRIMGIPIAELQIEQLKTCGVKDIYIITQFHENKEYISLRFSDGKKRFGLNIHYSDTIADRTNNGSGDAILTNIEKKKLTGNSIILPNDNLFEFDLEHVINAHNKSGAVISMLTTTIRPRETIKTYGLIKTDLSHRVTQLNEKPENERELMRALGISNPTQLDSIRAIINTAGYIIDNDRFREIAKEPWVVEGRKKSSGEFDMAGKFVAGMIERKYPVFSIPINAWGDFGSTNFFLDTFPDALSGKFPSIHCVLENQGYYHDSKKNIWIHPESLRMEDISGMTLKERMNAGKVKIGPNVFIGRQVTIEEGAEISYSDIEKNSFIGEGAQIERAYLSPFCEIWPFTEMRECALGQNVIVESSREKRTYVDGRSVVGSQIIIPAGSHLIGAMVYPGYVFKKEADVTNKKLIPTQKDIMTLVKQYQK
ncbi:MAG: sugar phosphate nucleotidyltransferase [archaeon]